MRPKVIILGAGLAGLSLARYLLMRSDLNTDIEIIESKSFVGGLSASFESEGIVFDFGSHRLHPSAPQFVLDDIKTVLEDDLLKRRRTGRICLDGRFIVFPISLLDAAMHLPFAFVAGMVKDTINGMFIHRTDPPQNFAEAAEHALGRTLCKSFYFPYARKLWGLDPTEISTEQASRRISAGNLLQVFRKAVSRTFQQRLSSSSSFYYPRRGFGQIAKAFADEIRKMGGNIRLSSSVCGIHLNKNRVSGISIASKKNRLQNETTEIEKLSADFVFSTIPVNMLVQMIDAGAPERIIQSAADLKFRGMLFVCLVLKMQQLTPYDGHYFPNEDIIFARISEPKNYSGATEPAGLTGLCAEIPCNTGDEIWNAPDGEVIERVVDDLQKIGFSVKSFVKTAFIRRSPNVYPIYDLNFRKNLEELYAYLDGLTGFATLGRQGLFLHNNVHNSIEVAYGASECLKSDLQWDAKRWESFRHQAECEVVLD